MKLFDLLLGTILYCSIVTCNSSWGADQELPACHPSMQDSAPVGYQCLSSKKGHFIRVQDVATGDMGWKDPDANFILYLPAREISQKYTVQQFTEDCRKRGRITIHPAILDAMVEDGIYEVLDPKSSAIIAPQGSDLSGTRFSANCAPTLDCFGGISYCGEDSDSPN